MTYYLYQNEQTLGPYPREDMDYYIREGYVMAMDYIFPEGATDWQPAWEVFPEGFVTEPAPVAELAPEGEAVQEMSMAEALIAADAAMMAVEAMDSQRPLVTGEIILPSHVARREAEAQKKLAFNFESGSQTAHVAPQNSKGQGFFARLFGRFGKK